MKDIEKEFIGKKFSKLTITSVFIEFKNGKNRRMAKCSCDCGETCAKNLYNVLYGTTTSCGCKKRGTRKHGLSEHTLYKVWVSMKDRCYNPSNASYHRYGKRGIKLCKEWRHNPEAFIEWSINNGWKKGLTIERRNNDGDYDPNNCSFIPKSEQTKNFCRNVFIEYNGEVKHMSEWARVFKTDAASIRYRWDKGLPLEGVQKLREKTVKMRIPVSKVQAVKNIIYENFE